MYAYELGEECRETGSSRTVTVQRGERNRYTAATPHSADKFQKSTLP